MLNFNSVMIGAKDPQALADFYAKAFDKKPDYAADGWFGFTVGDGSISIGSHDKVTGPSTNPERIMLNIQTDDVKGEFERIKATGAKVIAEPYSMGDDGSTWIATFADAEGNYFQLVTPWKS